MGQHGSKFILSFLYPLESTYTAWAPRYTYIHPLAIEEQSCPHVVECESANRGQLPKRARQRKEKAIQTGKEEIIEFSEHKSAQPINLGALHWWPLALSSFRHHCYGFKQTVCPPTSSYCYCISTTFLYICTHLPSFMKSFKLATPLAVASS